MLYEIGRLCDGVVLHPGEHGGFDELAGGVGQAPQLGTFGGVHFPLKFGVRFSLKALGPSWASSDAKTSHPISSSRARASVRPPSG